MRKFTYGFVMTLLFIAVSGFGFNSKPLSVEYHLKCCKICKKGKACGDTCISRDYECHKPPGCACDG
jgi:hypothetical protein